MNTGAHLQPSARQLTALTWLSACAEPQGQPKTLWPAQILPELVPSLGQAHSPIHDLAF